MKSKFFLMSKEIYSFDNIGTHFLLMLKLNYCFDTILETSLISFYLYNVNLKSLEIILTNKIYTLIYSCLNG